MASTIDYSILPNRYQCFLYVPNCSFSWNRLLRRTLVLFNRYLAYTKGKPVYPPKNSRFTFDDSRSSFTFHD